jgi:hypothetical protein
VAGSVIAWKNGSAYFFGGSETGDYFWKLIRFCRGLQAHVLTSLVWDVPVHENPPTGTLPRFPKVSPIMFVNIEAAYTNHHQLLLYAPQASGAGTSGRCVLKNDLENDQFKQDLVTRSTFS